MKYVILFKMRGDFTSDQILMLWFRKESLDTVGFWAYGQSPKPKGDIQCPKYA